MPLLFLKATSVCHYQMMADTCVMMVVLEVKDLQENLICIHWISMLNGLWNKQQALIVTAGFSP